MRARHTVDGVVPRRRCDGAWGHPCAIAATQYTPSRRVDVDTMTAPTSTPSPRRSDAVDARRPRRRRCTPKPLVQVTWTQFEKNLVEDLVPFGCPADSYNEVASLVFHR